MSKKNSTIYCNCCGRPICQVKNQGITDYLHITKEWGYFSAGKDGTVHSMDLCEPCYEKLVKSFAIPPEIDRITEFV